MEPNKGQNQQSQPNQGTQHQEETGTTKQVADYNKSQQGATPVTHGADDEETTPANADQDGDILGGKEDAAATDDK